MNRARRVAADGSFGRRGVSRLASKRAPGRCFSCACSFAKAAFDHDWRESDERYQRVSCNQNPIPMKSGDDEHESKLERMPRASYVSMNFRRSEERRVGKE